MKTEAINKIIKREGGYINHPNDRGGPTKYGITKPTLTTYLGRDVITDDIKNISTADAYEIYYRYYYQVPKIDELPEPVQEIVLDMAVNHGPKTAITLLQRVINQNNRLIAADGIIGPITKAATTGVIEEFGIKKLINDLIDYRIRFYERIVKKDDTQRVFLAGWVKRAESFRVTT